MPKSTLIVIALALLLFAGVAYFLLSSPDTDETPLFLSPEAQRISLELNELRRLRNLRLDTSLIKNPFLRTLEFPASPTTTLPSLGRQNPFLPF